MKGTATDEFDKFYYHRGQQLALLVQANTNVVIAPRRYGKSDGIIAPSLIRDVHGLPGLAGAIVSSTYKQAKTRTLPATFSALNRMGYIKDVHYVVGKQPPKNLGFKKPIVEPLQYDDVVSWWNGHLTLIISQDIEGSSNSYTLYYIKGDEAKFLNYKKLQAETIPANGGSQQFAPKDFAWTHGVLFCSDQPLLKSGQWLYDFEKECDQDLIKLIIATALKLGKLHKDKHLIKERYFEQRRRELEYELFMYRRNATWYHEADPFDNVDVIGTRYFEQMKKLLPPLAFQTAILNRRVRKIANGFYPALNEERHVYEAPSNEKIIRLDYSDYSSNKHGCAYDGDLITSMPLYIAFDYNSAINNVVTGQVDKGILRTVNWQYVKTPRKLKELCNEWCDYYEDYQTKKVVYYYDSTAIPQSASTNYTFMDIVVDTLTARGWKVYPRNIGQPMKHMLKHEYIDLALKGIKYLFPMFNKHNCELLFAAMEGSGIKIGRNGFEKDKGDEAKEDSPDNPDELKTHGPDAFDTLFIGCEFHYFDPETSFVGTSGFRK